MPKSVWLLVIGMFLNTTGNSFLWPLNTIYMHNHLGKSLSIAGLVLMINAGAGVLGNLIGGYLFDKIGGYYSIMTGIVITLVALTGMTIWHEWPHYVWFLTITGFSIGIVMPSMFAMVGAVWPEGGRKAFNAIYLASNLGVAVGPALAGPIAAISFDFLFISNLLLYIAFFLLAVIGYRKMDSKVVKEKTEEIEHVEIKNKTPFYALLIVCSGYLLTWIAYSQWPTTLSTHIQGMGISLNQYSLLWTINGLLIITLQPIISPIIRRFEKQIKGQLVFGVIVMMFSFIVIIFADSFKIFAFAMVILTLGEIFVFPAVPTIANEIAPNGKNGSYQGVVNSVAAIGRMIGPFFGGVMVDLYNMEVLIWILCSFFIIAIVPCLVFDRPLRKTQLVKDIDSI